MSQDEIDFYRKKLQEMEEAKPKKREDFYWLLRKIQVGSEPKGLPEECIDALVDALYPIFHPVDLVGKTVVVNIPMDGALPPGIMQKYYAYADFIKSMGAASVIFLQKGSELTALSDEQLKALGLRRLENGNSENKSS